MIESEDLFTILAVSAGVVAFAMLVMAGCALAIWSHVRRLSARSAEFMDQWEPVAALAEEKIKSTADQSEELLTRLNQLTALLHKEALQIESVVGTVTSAAKRNVDEVESTMKLTLEAINSTVAALDQAVRLPAKKLRALSAGFRAAVQHLSTPRRSDPARVSTDEEMFI